jgi:hypothetical protein
MRNKIFSYILAGFFIAILLSIVISRLFTGSGESSILFALFGLRHISFLKIGLLFGALAVLINDDTRRFLSTVLSFIFYGYPDESELGYRRQLSKSHIASMVLMNLLLFTGISLYYFTLRVDSLFAGVDGDYMVSLFYSQRIWNQSFWYLGNSFLQGLGGNVMFPLNTLVDPGYVIGGYSGTLNYPLAHVVWGLLLFISTLVLARTVAIGWITSIISAWLSPFLILFPQPLGFYPVASLIPHIATAIASTSFLLSILLVNRTRILELLIRSILIVSLTIYLTLNSPLTILLVSPVLAAVAIAKILTLRPARARAREFLMILVSALIIAVIGILPFFLGLVFNNGYRSFLEEFVIDRGYLMYASTLFYGFGWRTMPFAFFGLTSVATNRSSNLEARILSFSTLCLGSLILASGILNWLSPQLWKLPSPVYFEFFLWPIYSIAIAFFISRIFYIFRIKDVNKKLLGSNVCLYGQWLRAKCQVSAKYIKNSSLISSAILPLPLVAFLYFSSSTMPTERPWLFPPPESPIMNSLIENLSQSPSSEFKGRLATFTGMNISSPIHWIDLQDYDYSLLADLDNDFRKAGFWLHSIPTFTEYNSLISPRYYYVTSRIFSKEGDRQIRAMMTLRNINLNVLRLFGINHLITDKEIDSLQLISKEISSTDVIYLYGLQGANLSGFSPTDVFYIPDFDEAIDFMRSDNFDPVSQMVVEKDVNTENMVPVTTSKLIVNKDSYEVVAASEGESILVLPIEYSSCFEVVNKGSEETLIDIFPGNILLMSVHFNKNLNIFLSYRNGVFNNSSCRLKDYFEFENQLAVTR